MIMVGILRSHLAKCCYRYSRSSIGNRSVAEHDIDIRFYTGSRNMAILYARSLEMPKSALTMCCDLNFFENIARVCQ